MTWPARNSRAASRTLGLLILAALAGCSQLTPADESRGTSVADTPFALTGRLSARHGNDALAANVRWLHAPGTDTLDLATPLGQTLARMARTDGGVSVALADGQRHTAPTFAALTEQAFGVTIPVEGLAYWIRGQPRPGSAFRGERDAAGHLQTLDQDGWALVYTYTDGADGAAALPRRVTLAYPGIDLRIVIDDWR